MHEDRQEDVQGCAAAAGSGPSDIALVIAGRNKRLSVHLRDKSPAAGSGSALWRELAIARALAAGLAMDSSIT